ncbi:MAG: hypothetical protein CL926_11830 [Deltaproteobacteria bacterium]|nr:hypothetical protein [Deltaproteobacteria bacterium]
MILDVLLLSYFMLLFSFQFFFRFSPILFLFCFYFVDFGFLKKIETLFVSRYTYIDSWIFTPQHGRVS